MKFTLDLLDYTMDKNIPAFIFCIDFEKVSGLVLSAYNTFFLFNFGYDLCNWASTFYNYSTVPVINYGLLVSVKDIH